MTVSLIEEFLLLTLEDEGGEFDNIPEVSLRCGIVGAALMDLAIRGRIDADLEAVWAADPTPTGDAVLDRVLAALVAEPARLPPGMWIERLSKRALELRGAALEHLCARGVLHRQDHRFLWAMATRRYPISDGQERTEVKRRITALLFNDEIPEPHDIALIGLAEACGVFERILTPAVYGQVRDRIGQIARLDLIGGVIVRTAREVTAKLKLAERRAVIAGIVGNSLGCYSYAVFGFFAIAIGQQFFPSDDPAISLLASFGIFTTSALVGPAGSALFGYVSDRIGRRIAFVVSTTMMIVAALVTACLPTYRVIGVWAPVLLVLMRVLEGLGAAGEASSSVVLMVEEAQSSRRGRAGSVSSSGNAAGVLLGSAVGLAALDLLPAGAASLYGWRLASVFGSLLGIAALLLRRRMPEEDTVADYEEERTIPLLTAIRREWRPILKVFSATMIDQAVWNILFIYAISWFIGRGYLAAAEALLLNGLALLLMIVVHPLGGGLSDRVGRKPVLLLSCGAMAVLAWPLFWLMSQPSIYAIVVGVGGFAAMLGAFEGASAAFEVESFPRQVRGTAVGIAYTIAELFGSVTPMAAILLIQLTGYPLAPVFVLVPAAIISFLAVALSRSNYRPGAV